MLQTLCTHLVRTDLLPEVPVVIDAGACIGAFIDAMRAIRPKARIIGIEANMENVDVLLRMNDPNLSILPMALTRESAPRTVYFNELINRPEDGYVSVVELDFRAINARTIQHRCLTTNVPRIMGQMNLDHVDLLKLDIEGMEREILRTLPATTARKITQITMETHEWSWTPEMARECLIGLGFSVESQGVEVLGYRNGD